MTLFGFLLGSSTNWVRLCVLQKLQLLNQRHIHELNISSRCFIYVSLRVSMWRLNVLKLLLRCIETTAVVFKKASCLKYVKLLSTWTVTSEVPPNTHAPNPSSYVLAHLEHIPTRKSQKMSKRQKHFTTPIAGVVISHRSMHTYTRYTFHKCVFQI